MTAADFATALTQGPALTVSCVAASWDEHLSQSLNVGGHAVLEESVLQFLLEDLSRIDQSQNNVGIRF